MTTTLELLAKQGGELDRISACPFQKVSQIEALPYREYPHWHVLLSGRHIGLHRQDDRICNWVARTLTVDGKYRQKCLGPALDLSKKAITFDLAISRAFEWFDTGVVKALSVATQYVGRTTSLSISPIGEVYTVGHAMQDYLEWSKVARSAGGHYNNLSLMNYHLVPNLSAIPIEEFNAKHLQSLALTVLERPPKRGFENTPSKVAIDTLSVDEIRKRKRTFNSLVTILRMVFRYAWENGHLRSERSWKCLNRVSVNHQPRTIFLSRSECLNLVQSCNPALRQLVLAALYSGCRVGELGELRVEDVSKEGLGLHVQPFKRSPHRFVFLPSEGMKFFLQASEGKSPSDLLFCSSKGKKWRRQHTLLFRTAVAKAGLPKEFVFHGLRHTYASDLIGRGETLDTVAKQLGHANTQTVMNTYGHLADRVREKQIHECFSPLVEQQCQTTYIGRNSFEERSDNSDRMFAKTLYDRPQISTLPRSSLARPSKEVMEVFSSLPGEH